MFEKAMYNFKSLFTIEETKKYNLLLYSQQVLRFDSKQSISKAVL